MMFSSKVVLVSLLAASAGSARINHNHNMLGEMEEESLPMHLYKKDCGKHRPVPGVSMLALPSDTAKQSLLSKGKIPGAGVEVHPVVNGSQVNGSSAKGSKQFFFNKNVSVGAFEKVLKDGYYEVDCVKDSMYQFGDKYGDNRHEYNIGDVTGVSIVLYERHVAKMDREDMTHAVCFAFCRTVPDMLYFGIVHGRQCYCAPYYKPMESDSSQCDSTCVGDPGTMCGGKTKSNVFQMHMCADTANDLQDAQGKLDDVRADLTDVHARLDSAAETMQVVAAELQGKFGKAGDPAASDLMQEAKKYAGVLEHSAEAGHKQLTKMEGLHNASTGMRNGSLASVGEIAAAEGVVKNMLKETSAGETQIRSLTKLADSAAPVEAEVEATNATAAPASNVTNDAYEGAQDVNGYYPVMYFVDKEFKSVPSTCSGDLVGQPLVGSIDACAAACDADVHSCVGFSHFSNGKPTGAAAAAAGPVELTPDAALGGMRCAAADRLWQLTGPNNVEADCKTRCNDDPTCVALVRHRGYCHGCTAPPSDTTKDTLVWQKAAAAPAAAVNEAAGELCFLFSSFNTAQYYTGCAANATKMTCMAKLSKFEGTTLKPNPSGKCKQCLKTAKKADRCY